MSQIIKDGENIMSIELALEIAQHNAVVARLPEAGEFGRIADLLNVVATERPDCFDFAMDFLGGEDAEQVLAYVQRLEDALPKWQPISTVPPEVDEILAADADGNRFVAWFDDGEWHSCEGFVPIKWMALAEVQS